MLFALSMISIVLVIGGIAAIAAAGESTSPQQPAAKHTAPAVSSPATEPSPTRQPSLFVTEATNIWPGLSQVPAAKVVSLGDTMCNARGRGVTQRQLIKVTQNNAGAQALGISDAQRFILLSETLLCPAYTAPVIRVATPTVAESNALRSAQEYLSTQAFSRLGLIDQLSSKYGDGYSKTDATWAIDHVHANWNAEAVKSAKEYLQMEGFSRSGLIDQLSSPYGDKYTVAQATYAADKVGLQKQQQPPRPL